MLALKVHRTDARNWIYVLTATVADRRVAYGGGGQGTPWERAVARARTVRGAECVRVKLHPDMGIEPVWRAPPEMHDDLVVALSGPEKLLIEVVPKDVLAILRRPEPPEVRQLNLGGPLADVLKPYQRDGVAFIASRRGRALLFDMPGLGKTLQALAVIQHYAAERPALIVCPSCVLRSWANHCEEYLRTQANTIRTHEDAFVEDGINIVSYGMLTSAKFAAKLDAFQPRVLIVDESHQVKNGKAQRTKRVFAWSKRALRVVLMTGTPACKPLELYSQIKCIDQNLFKKFFHYQKTRSRSGLVLSKKAEGPFYYANRYCCPTLEAHGGRESFAFNGSDNEQELHALLRHTLMMRRVTDEVLKDLPSLTRERVFMKPWQQPDADAYEVGSVSFMEKVRETSTRKLPEALKYLQEIVWVALENDATLKVLVWAHHHHILDALREAAETAGINHVCMDGRTSASVRADRVEAFQTDPRVRVAILGLGAMYSGVTLTKATLAVVVELCFSADVHEQSEKRSNRIGATLPTVVRYLVSTGSTDSVVWNMLSRKVQVAGRCIDGAEKTFAAVGIKRKFNTQE